MSFYARIKVLTEKGKELATVETPYLNDKTPITDIKARTIHADGTVIPLVGKPEDLLTAKITARNGDKLDFERKVFNLPSVEVGSILEYSYQVRYDDKYVSSPKWFEPADIEGCQSAARPPGVSLRLSCEKFGECPLDS